MFLGVELLRAGGRRDLPFQREACHMLFRSSIGLMEKQQFLVIFVNTVAFAFYSRLISCVVRVMLPALRCVCSLEAIHIFRWTRDRSSLTFEIKDTGKLPNHNDLSSPEQGKAGQNQVCTRV